MAIPESQLETWSHQGAIQASKATADSIKETLGSFRWPEDVRFDIYLQGSYKNSTNIRGDSDVDVVAQLNSFSHSNLSDDWKSLSQYKSMLKSHVSKAFDFQSFRRCILEALRDCYGVNRVYEGNKTLKLKAGNGMLSADIVACVQYRSYKAVSHNDYVEGMCFCTRGGEILQIINYPKLHYENGVRKHKITRGWYKPIVRMFKNMRRYIPSDETPSYFLECLVYNVPNSYFGTSYQDSFCRVINWLNKARLEGCLKNFVYQNEQDKLFGSSYGQWNLVRAGIFIQDVIHLWDNWQNRR